MTMIFGIAFVVVGALCAQPAYEYRTVVSDLDTPWEIIWGPDGWIWITERPGRISRVHPDTGEHQLLARIDEVAEVSESGLMGMAFHPNFTDSPLVYVVYTYWGANRSLWNKVVSYRFTGDTLLFDAVILDSMRGFRIHDGARLWTLEDRTLLITMGDAGQMTLAQDLDSYNGKLLRIHLDGSIPADNPFPNSPVYAYGLRNSQGLVVANGKIYVSDHGPASDDEVNLILKGRNYGWPNVMGWCDSPDEQDFCQQYRVVEPMMAWTPTLAVCGLDYYHADRFPEWKNSLLMVTLKASRLVQLQLNPSGDSIVAMKEYFVRQFGRLRDLCISPDGRVFLATSNRDGRGKPPFPLPDDDRIVEILPAVSTVPTEGKSGYWHIVPHKRALRIQINVMEQHPLWLRIYDVQGSLVVHRLIQPQKEYIIPLPVAGLYVCRLYGRGIVLENSVAVVW